MTLGAAAVAMAFPFYWMVVTTRPARGRGLQRRAVALAVPDLVRHATRSSWPIRSCRSSASSLNSLVIATGATVANVATAALAAFALSRHAVPGGTLVYYAVIATMMVPGEVVLIGLFRVVNALGLIDSYLGMILSAGGQRRELPAHLQLHARPCRGSSTRPRWWTGPDRGRCSGG